MLQASELRINTFFVWRGEPWRVLSYKHTHLGRGSADVRVKIRGLVSGTVKSQAFAPTQRFEEAAIIKQTMQFLYREGENLIFMHPISFEQLVIKNGLIGEMESKFLQEGEEVLLLFWDERPIGVELPPKVVVTVAECGPGVKGNSATNIYKPAKLDNGAVVKVPLFVSQGERVRIDTKTGEYVDRAG